MEVNGAIFHCYTKLPEGNNNVQIFRLSPPKKKGTSQKKGDMLILNIPKISKLGD